MCTDPTFCKADILCKNERQSPIVCKLVICMCAAVDKDKNKTINLNFNKKEINIGIPKLFLMKEFTRLGIF